MQVTLSIELARQVEDLVAQGGYASADAVVAEALEEMLLRRARVDAARLEAVLEEAEDSGHAPMTALDWDDIERAGLATIESRKRA